MVGELKMNINEMGKVIKEKDTQQNEHRISMEK